MELRDLLGKVETWRLLLRKLTPSEVKAEMIRQVLKQMGLELDEVQLGRVMEKVKGSGSANVYNMLLDPEFQESVSLIVKDSTQTEVDPSRSYTICPHCNLPFELGTTTEAAYE